MNLESLRKWLRGEQEPSAVTGEQAEGKEEWVLLEKVVNDAFTEQRRSRQWGIFFKLLTFIYLFAGVVIFLEMRSPSSYGNGDDLIGEGHTALVRLDGVIAEDQEASANAIAAALRNAFKHEDTKAVIMAINSPGGSPVQSDYMFMEIKRLREKHPDIKLYAVISDIGASGGYYVASAADEIYVNPASLVGSIGVTSAGFGFVEAIDKLGIERRDFTAGKHKSFLDPFQPSREDEVEFWQTVLEDTHQLFIDRVREGRGDRLKESEDMFSGLIWNGRQAVEMGLADGFASAGQVARDIVGSERIKDFTVRRSPFAEMFGGFGASVGKGMASYIEEQSTKMKF